MAHLFFPMPMQWGLRGDPYLWREIRRRVGRVELPASIDELESLLREAICDVLATDWAGFTAQEQIYNESLAHGGMSSGHVSPRVWTDRFLPLLLARAAALHAYSWHRSEED